MKINPPNWPKEYTLAEFAELNPHIINENQLIQLYNQYLNKYLQERYQQQLHFKQSKFTQLISEFQNCQIIECANQALSTMGGGSYSGPGPSGAITFAGDTAPGTLPNFVKTLGGPQSGSSSSGSLAYKLTGPLAEDLGGFTNAKNRFQNYPFGYDLFDTAQSSGPGTSNINENPNSFKDGATFSFWIKPHEFGTAGNPMTAWGAEYSDKSIVFGVNGDELYLDIGKSLISSSAYSSSVSSSFDSGTGIGNIPLNTTGSFSHGMELDQWYHWAVMVRADSPEDEYGVDHIEREVRFLDVYRNGTKVLSTFYRHGNMSSIGVGSATYNRGGGEGLDGSSRIYIGGTNVGNNFSHGWACSISEFSIFNKQIAISNLYNGSTPVDQTTTDITGSGLIAYWKFNDEPGSTTVTDYGPLGFHSILTGSTDSIAFNEY